MRPAEAGWTKTELKLLDTLDEPIKVQRYLDDIGYDAKDDTRSPRYVMKEREAHCFEGALFAAACLSRMGHPPLILDLEAVNDDDHVIAVFKEEGRWGAVAKSNFTTLRFREPVYRSLRELAMSYFDLYFNTILEKTLREYSLPLNLDRYASEHWMTTDRDLEFIGDDLAKVRHLPLISKGMAGRLQKVGPYLLEAGLLGSNKDGLYRPEG